MLSVSGEGWSCKARGRAKRFVDVVGEDIKVGGVKEKDVEERKS